MSTIKDESFGIVQVCMGTDGQWRVLLIHQISNMRGDSYWILPKGHKEKGETSLQTALRELKEETGLKPDKVVDRDFTLAYTFHHEGQKIEKTVTFYIGFITDTEQLSLQPEEVVAARWYSKEQAYKKVTHDNARRLLKEVFVYLETV